MLVTDAGISMKMSADLLNIEVPMEASLLVASNVMDVSCAQDWNASLPMLVTELGISIVGIGVSWKA